MALISWNESLSVNVAEVDRQHKKLIDLIVELNNAMKQGKGKEVLGGIIDALTDYTITHFGFEEKHFDKLNYPDKDIHKKAHADFIKKIQAFKTEFDNKKLGLSIEVIDFLSDWLQTHIKVTDKKYGPFFNENGIM